MREKVYNIYSDAVKKYYFPRVLEYYEKNYDILWGQGSNFDKEDAGALLGDPEGKTCRFCGKSYPEVSFEKDAHVFPRCTGNENLLSAYECDNCNILFGSILEGEYANLFNFCHTIYGVVGRKKIPILQSNDNGSTLKVVNHPEKEGNLHIVNEGKNSIHTVIDPEKKIFEYEGPGITILPIAVYKCLTKMALTIMPEAELDDFFETLKWVHDKKHEPFFENKKHLCRYMEFYGEYISHPIGFLFKRKPKSKDGPYMIFMYYYAKMVLMIEIPTKKHIYPYDIKKVQPPFIVGTPFEEKVIDLSSCEKIRIVPQSRSFTWGAYHDITREANNILTTNKYAQLIQREIRMSNEKRHRKAHDN